MKPQKPFNPSEALQMKAGRSDAGTENTSGARTTGFIGNPEENAARTKSNLIDIPSITLPKGGGALKSIDEKFEVNAANGTASWSIPLPLSASRNSLSPSLSLTYNSGAGNGPFGIGWQADVPSIQRKTEKHLPQYQDALESDTFIFSGAEDLVPELISDSSGQWKQNKYTSGSAAITVYKPRIEGSFVRIEKIEDQGNVYWKLHSRDNVVSVYGISAGGKITSPVAGEETHTFKWCLEYSYDDKGNFISYVYKKENFDQVIPSLPNKNRLNNASPYTNLYLKSIRYGNKTAYYEGDAFPVDFCFELILDYGEHDATLPTTLETGSWLCRMDSFSNYRSGFEIRTNRLCRRLLMFHHFKTELGWTDYLVKSVDFTYDEQANITYLQQITQNGYIWNTDGTLRSRKSLPPFEFSYFKPGFSKEVRELKGGSITDAPTGFDNREYKWLDLYGEGISGLLTDQGGGWFYKENRGQGTLAPAKLILRKPSFSGLTEGSMSLQELGADGRRYMVSMTPGMRGFFELEEDKDWQSFCPFSSFPNIDLQDPNLKFIDLNGDGMPDMLISHEQEYIWYAAKGIQGYDDYHLAAKAKDEESGPQILFSNADEQILIATADMSGDGLSDIVIVTNASVSYYPNLGYGRFGAKVSMTLTDSFDTNESFNPQNLYLADIDGSGTTDIVYIGKASIQVWFNQSGNSLTGPSAFFNPFPALDNYSTISFADIMGNGTSCLVWSSALPGNGNSPLRYIDLMDGKKPHVLYDFKNNLGKEISLEYKTSTRFYLDDKNAGLKWITRLPFPVQCVSKVTKRDLVSQTRLVNEYTYHHGYYDSMEREFRGFARVEQKDTEEFDQFVTKTSTSGALNTIEKDFYQPAVITKSWFHTGAWLHGNKLLHQLSDEYYPAPDYLLNEPPLPAGLSADEAIECFRALKGLALRQEIYSDEGDDLQKAQPYSIVQQNYNIQLLQPRVTQRYAVFLTTEKEKLTLNCDRTVSDPRIGHTLNLEIDPFGNVLQSASIVYGRKKPDLALPTDADRARQAKQWITYTLNKFTAPINTASAKRLPMACESQTWELTAPPPANTLFGVEEIRQLFQQANVKMYEQEALLNEKRKIEHSRTYFLKNDFSGPLPLGQADTLGLTYENYLLAFTPTLLTNLYGTKTDDLFLRNKGQYVRSEADANYWIRSGRIYCYPDLSSSPALSTVPPPTPADLSFAKQNFYLPVVYEDNFGNLNRVFYDPYRLLNSKQLDAYDNEIAVEAVNYRTVKPYLMHDSNDNRSGLRFDEFGFVSHAFVMGKATESKGDLLDTSSIELSSLDQPTSILEYEFRYFTSAGTLPNRVKISLRENHYYKDPVPPSGTGIIAWLNSLFGSNPPAAPAIQTNVIWQTSYSYSDGSGHEVLKKIQAEPGIAPLRNAQGVLLRDGDGNLQYGDTGAELRWVGNGRTIYNNKGKAVKQYEPYFDSSPEYNNENELVFMGFTALMRYDALGRLIRTDRPNGTYSESEFTPWQQLTWDENDTVKSSDWYTIRINGSKGPDEQDAAQKASVHDGTPSLVYSDSLGRTFLARGHNKSQRNNETLQENFYYTRNELDIEGNARSMTDTRGNAVMTWKYDMLGTICYQNSMDAGERWCLNDSMKKTLRMWDSRKQVFSYSYDSLNRPLDVTVNPGSGDLVIEQNLYGESLADAKTRNVRQKLYQHKDTAGVSISEAYDFKGNPLLSTRQLLSDYKNSPDWNSAPALDTVIYSTETSYDALNRPVQIIAPDQSILTPAYNAANLLKTLDVNIKGGSAVTSFITGITYNARGQREQTYYANNTTTRYTYQPDTYRMIRLLTTANNGGSILQDLNYTFDPVGNITRLLDNAQETVFFGGQQVDAVSNYNYDALYRLIEAEGREHTGQLSTGAYDNFSDDWGKLLLQPNSAIQLRNYSQKYDYDGAGNITSLKHMTSNGGSWTRLYQYNPANNQLVKTNIGPLNFSYTYNAHGSMASLPNLSQVDWNFREEMQHANLAGGGEAWYTYDSGGKRVRKVIEKSATSSVERIYLGIFEIYRERNKTGITLERETLHVMDVEDRVAMIETLTKGKDGSFKQLIRYQYSNYQDSAALELDDFGKIISYEEYHPYGTTAYQATDSSRQVPAKRYRYTAMERDDETGLGYHTSRYYVPWLGRWLSADPSGIQDSINVYQYVSGNPMKMIDPSGMSGWDRFMGGLKMVGGGIETVAGVGLVLAGAATSEIGVGIPIAAAGVFVTAHGADTTQSGARTMWNGAPVDSFTSQGLQGLGMSRTAANLTDAGISVVGTLGANAITRAPGVVAAASDTVSATGETVTVAGETANATTPSVSLAFKPGLPGHNMVGVDLADGTGTVWSDLRLAQGANIERTSGIATSITGETVVEVISEGPNAATYSTLTVPVSASRAQAAMSVVDTAVSSSTATGTAGQYGFLANDCTTYASGVMKAAGVGTPPLSSPLINYLSVASQSPQVMVPLTTAGATIDTTVGVYSYVSTPSTPNASVSTSTSDVFSSGATTSSSPVSSSIASDASSLFSSQPQVCTSEDASIDPAALVCR
jgi:RHS repeat-associated protein